MNRATHIRFNHLTLCCKNPCVHKNLGFIKISFDYCWNTLSLCYYLGSGFDSGRGKSTAVVTAGTAPLAARRLASSNQGRRLSICADFEERII